MNYKNRHISAAMTAIDAYLKEATEKKKEISELSKSYAGDLLRSKQQAIMDEVAAAQKKAAEAVKAANAALDAAVKAQETAALDAANISADFALLNLPVKLTPAQLTTLAERNRDNSLFIQALNQHADKAGYPDLIFEDRTVSMKKAAAEFKALTREATIPGDAFEIAENLSWTLLSGLEILEAADAAIGGQHGETL